MAAGYQDIFLNQSETFTTSITLDDVNGLPYNLTDFSVKCQAKKSYYANNVIINFDTIINDANNGIITLSANSAVTANIPSTSKLVYDVFIKDNISGGVTKVLEGQIYISPAVTSPF